MRNILIPITLVAMIWSACSKSDPPGGGFDSPVFSVGFEAPPDSGFGLTAGLNGTYLFTKVEGGTVSNRVLVMSGAFADASCPAGDCPGSVKFEFKNEWLENFVRPDSIFGYDQSWEYQSPLNDTLYNVTIQWVTPEGSVLRSDILPQPQDTSGSLSHFIILDSEPWEMNERGEKTWKMNVDFSCWLFDSIQSQERRIMGSGVIAVGYR